jgi:hypothetical protein
VFILDMLIEEVTLESKGNAELVTSHEGTEGEHKYSALLFH